MRRRASARAGFTLVEVLIGIAVLAMLATLIAGGIRMGGRAWTGAERRTANSDDMVLVQNLLRRTIVRARPAYASADPSDRIIVFAGEPNALGLMAPQPGTQYAGPWVYQRFFVNRYGDSRALFVNLRRVQAAGAYFQVATPDRIMVLDHVSDVRFAYFGSASAGEPPAWWDSWMNRTRLPDLVRVRITRDSPALRAWPELIVATRVTANAGCIYDGYSAECRRVR